MILEKKGEENQTYLEKQNVFLLSTLINQR